jgi:hypothetical protein
MTQKPSLLVACGGVTPQTLDEEWFIFQAVSELSYYLSIVELLSK